MQRGFAQARESVAQLELELSASQAQLRELGGAQAAAASERSSDLAEIGSSASAVRRQVGAVSERVVGTEAKCEALAAALAAQLEAGRRGEAEAGLRREAQEVQEGNLRREMEAQAAWSAEARAQLLGLEGFDAVQLLARSAHEHLAALQQARPDPRPGPRPDPTPGPRPVPRPNPTPVPRPDPTLDHKLL